MDGSEWCADYEGRFRGATKLKGIKDFHAKDYGLVPIQLDTWGQFVFIMADPSRYCFAWGSKSSMTQVTSQPATTVAVAALQIQ